MDIASLYDDVRVRVPAAPAPIVDLAAQRALGEFFRKSTAWRVTLGQLAIEANKADYALPAPEGAILAVTGLKIAETQQDIVLRTKAQIVNEYGMAWKLAKGTTPMRATQDSPTALRLVPIPETTGNHLEVEVALYPTAETTDIPDWIVEMYRDELVDGIIGALKEMPGYSWSSEKDAARLRNTMVDAALRARQKVDKNFTRAPQRARFTSFDDL